VGTEAQVAALNRDLPDLDVPDHPVLVIGSGKVGFAAARALTRKDIRVHVLDRDRQALERLEGVADAIFVGDAADRQILTKAGLGQAPTVLLTTNDDAMNIYLAVYCRRLNAALRIVSRITHERNVEAIHRAGADFVLSYASLGVNMVFSLLRGHDVVVLGEGIDLFTLPVPASLAGRTVRESGIGSRTGLSVVAVQHDGRLVTQISSDMPLEAGAELVMFGSLGQRRTFAEAFE
jgi:Trk K+ transport system NAD-binding subunit